MGSYQNQQKILKVSKVKRTKTGMVKVPKLKKTKNQSAKRRLVEFDQTETLSESQEESESESWYKPSTKTPTEFKHKIAEAFGDNKDREETLNTILDSLKGSLNCPFCAKVSKTKPNLRTHIEGIHCTTEVSYPCDFCEKVCRSRHALECHKSRHHKSRSQAQ